MEADSPALYRDIIERLSARLPEEAIQRTKKAVTKKSYDTDGYGYQYVVDRFNDVLGVNWGYSFKTEDVLRGTYKSGSPCVEITVTATIWIIDEKYSRSCAGGHTSSNYPDALKGAMTNAFKKTAAFFGVGRDAYAGTIDDDNAPLPEPDSEKSGYHEASNEPDEPGEKKPTRVSDDDRKKLEALPELIKKWFRERMWSASDVIDACNTLNWNYEQIRQWIEKQK